MSQVTTFFDPLPRVQPTFNIFDFQLSPRIVNPFESPVDLGGFNGQHLIS